MNKKIFGAIFAVFSIALLILLVPAFGVRSASAASKPKLSPKSATLKVGDTLQLKMTGAKVVSYKIKKTKYATVSKTGLVTAKKAYSKVIKVRVTCDNGKTYKCKLTIVGANGGQPGGSGSTGFELGSGSKAVYVNNATELSEAGYMGWFNAQPKTKYKEKYVYDGTITNKDELIKFAQEAMENGAKEFTFNYKGNFYTAGDSSCWWNWLNAMTCQYSILGGYGNQIQASFSHKANNSYEGTATIKVTYKEAWKAVTYLKHTGYTPTDDAKRIAGKCLEIVDKALAECGNDQRAVLLYINDELCRLADYDYAAAGAVMQAGGDDFVVDSKHDATGVLFEGKGVCEAYTAAYRTCLEILGIENCVINNKQTVPGSNNGHTWNYVKLNGEWLHCDVTWNDTWDNRFFMINDLTLAKLREEEDNKSSHEFYTSYLPH